MGFLGGKVGKILKKGLTIAGGLAGVGTGGAMAVGETLTGDIIFDTVLLIGCIVIVAINGKEGVPDWMGNLLKSRRDKK